MGPRIGKSGKVVENAEMDGRKNCKTFDKFVERCDGLINLGKHGKVVENVAMDGKMGDSVKLVQKKC